MKPVRLHLLYEHGADFRPFGSAYIRLLRPLTHPVFRGKLAVTYGRSYNGSTVDAVVVDRLWRPDISLELARQLRERTRRTGASLFFALDDHLLELAEERKDWRPSEAQMRAFRFFLAESDGVIVTTEGLRKQLQAHNPNIAVVPNMLDDRLLDGREAFKRLYPSFFRHWLSSALEAVANEIRTLARPQVTVGYMGTFTHDDDLLMILPALREVCQQHSGELALVLLGVAAQQPTLGDFHRLPARTTRRIPRQAEYPDFMRWFSRTVNWDIAISPLRDTAFNRCKSDIKFLDYSAVGAAGIYSRVPAYTETVRHRETGWLAENTVEAWCEALHTLIDDAMLRGRIANNASRYLYSERIVARSSEHWLTALDRLLG